MKKLIIIILITAVTSAVGLYFRPAYPLIGQLDWWNVLSKGYFVGSFEGFFTQAMLDESFWFVMRFSAGGFVAGVISAFMLGGKKA